MHIKEAEVFIWVNIGPMCCVENKVVIEVDSRGIKVSSTVKTVLINLQIFSVLYNSELKQDKEVANYS